MTLFSAFEDFVHRSLGALPATWSKLLYVAGLRSKEGGYQHWGLERTHGVEAAQEALPHAHRELFLEVLRTPTPALLEDAHRSAADQQQPTEALVAELNARQEQLVPGDPGGGSREHFSLVLAALSSLLRGRRSSSRPDA